MLIGVWREMESGRRRREDGCFFGGGDIGWVLGCIERRRKRSSGFCLDRRIVFIGEFLFLF